jgi:hypothetical protein
MEGFMEVEMPNGGARGGLLVGLLATLVLFLGTVCAPSAVAEPIVCEGDSCQPLPPEPEDQVVNTLVVGPGNPAVHYVKIGAGRKHSGGKGPGRKGSSRRDSARK